jgi:hypothetical protein
VAPAPAPRGEAQGAAVGSRLFVFGGFTSGGPVNLPATARSDAYDAATNAWQPVADLPVVVTHAPAVVDGETIWLIGGYVGDSPGPATDQVWRYSVVTNAWSPGPALPAARGAGGAAIIGGELHYFGGTSRGSGKGSPDEEEHWALRLDGGTTWEPRAPLPNPRNHLAGVTLGNRLYAIGGQHAENENTGNQRQVDAYDPATDAWSGWPTCRPRADTSRRRRSSWAGASWSSGERTRATRPPRRWRPTTPRRTRGQPFRPARGPQEPRGGPDRRGPLRRHGELQAADAEGARLALIVPKLRAAWMRPALTSPPVPAACSERWRSWPPCSWRSPRPPTPRRPGCGSR